MLPPSGPSSCKMDWGKVKNCPNSNSIQLIISTLEKSASMIVCGCFRAYIHSVCIIQHDSSVNHHCQCYAWVNSIPWFFSPFLSENCQNLVLYVADRTYLTHVDIDFKEDDLWVLVAQHVESRGYSDTGPTPEETEDSTLAICSSLSSTGGQSANTFKSKKLTTIWMIHN